MKMAKAGLVDASSEDLIGVAWGEADSDSDDCAILEKVVSVDASSEDLIGGAWGEADSDSDDCAIVEKVVSVVTREQERKVDSLCFENLQPESKVLRSSILNHGAAEDNHDDRNNTTDNDESESDLNKDADVEESDGSDDNLGNKYVEFPENSVQQSYRGTMQADKKVIAVKKFNNNSLPVSLKLLESAVVSTSCSMEDVPLKDQLAMSSDEELVDDDVLKLDISQIVDRDAFCEVVEDQSNEKRKCEDDSKLVKKVRKHIVVKSYPGKYSMFYTDVGVSQEGWDGRNRRVKCLLCNDGTIVSTANFGQHVSCNHLEDVECEGCGEEFRASRISWHQQKCEGLLKLC